jgi:hypothetical protein
MRQRVIDHPRDAIYVESFDSGKVHLRIGGYGQGEGRYAILSPKKARILAYAILRAAEGSQESN